MNIREPFVWCHLHRQACSRFAPGRLAGLAADEAVLKLDRQFQEVGILRGERRLARLEVVDSDDEEEKELRPDIRSVLSQTIGGVKQNFPDIFRPLVQTEERCEKLLSDNTLGSGRLVCLQGQRRSRRKKQR